MDSIEQCLVNGTETSRWVVVLRITDGDMTDGVQGASRSVMSLEDRLTPGK